jgi:DNA-binding transcriptional MocR family regulator
VFFEHPPKSRSAKGVAQEVARLISDGSLAPGTRLPTIRVLATELGLSATTVAQAWKTLADWGLIEPRGKLGTRVRGTTSRAATGARFAKVSSEEPGIGLDLTTGTPDPLLLPGLGSALVALAAQGDTVLTSNYLDRAVVPQLESELVARWPYPPQRLTVVDGALDALDRLFRLLLHPGDRVAVENPTFPPVLDLIERAGAEAVPVDLDAEGPTTESLTAALEAEPVLLVIQPRAQNPSGVSMSPQRAVALAKVLAGTSTIIIEDDHAGGISSAPQVSLGTTFPENVIRILSFSKAFGPDLRLAAVAGPQLHVDALERDRTLGSGWSSRLLQHVLLHLLRDPQTLASLADARETYAQRRSSLVEALARAGVAVGGTDGINLWIPVADEDTARISLAARDVAVAPGSAFTCKPGGGDHVRLTCATVASDFDELAQQVARAAGVTRRQAGSPRGGR